MKYPLYLAVILTSFSATAMADAIYTAQGTIPLPSKGTMPVFSDNTPSKKQPRFVDQGGNLKIVENNPPEPMQPSQSQPDPMQPSQSQPGSMQPSQPQPDPMQPSQPKPGPMQPSQSQPGSMQPSQSQPGQPQPGLPK